MLPLFTNSEIAQIDHFTIRNSTSSFELISRASKRFIQWLFTHVEFIDNVHIMCGPGNNGADGYQIAIYLAQRGISVRVFTINIFKNKSPENDHLHHRLYRIKDIKHDFINGPEEIPASTTNALLIDAILGNGISRPIRGKLKEIVDQLNQRYSTIYSVDVPSGLMKHDLVTDCAIHAKATFAFEVPKLSFFDPANERFTGAWSYGSIGLSDKAKSDITPKAQLLESNDICNMIRPRPANAHKGMMGKALLLTSENPMKGAIQLVALACLSSGAGYTYLVDHSDSLTDLPLIIPEVIRIPEFELSTAIEMGAIAIGPGLGQSSKATQLLDKVLEINQVPLVLDADALNIISNNNWFKRIPKGAILTPHFKEFDRLFGQFSSHANRISEQKKQSLSQGIVIVLKGRYSSISNSEGNLYFNDSGNPGLAKGGSGDVLTGIITGLLAQGYSPFEAASIGVHVHGLTADLALRDTHEKAIRPAHLHRLIGKVLLNIKNAKSKKV